MAPDVLAVVKMSLVSMGFKYYPVGSKVNTPWSENFGPMINGGQSI